MSNRMNLVVIVADTFRSDYLGCYGNPWIKTPYLDKLASDGIVFSNCYADGLPTIPERRVFFTGKSIIPWTVHGNWQPLGEDDVTLPAVLKQAGYTTAFITDTYHYFKARMNFHKDFDAWEWIRGQENDPWKSGQKADFDPRDHMPDHLWTTEGPGGRNYDAFMRQYMMNTQDMRTEDDYFCARTFRGAMTWLERHDRQDPFLLFVDTFDPHEPWDAPKRFQDMYHEDYPCERFLFGYGVRNEDIRPGDHKAIRALYAAEVSFVDLWVGRFLARLDELGFRDDTIIVFTTDHGTHLGEKGCFQKTRELLTSAVSRLPLIVRHPDPAFAGRKIDSLVSSTDYMPTFLDMLDVAEQPEMDGVNFWELADGKKDTLHERVFSEFPPFASVRDADWLYFQSTSDENTGMGPALYDVKQDPAETTNVIDANPDVASELRGHLAERLGAELP